MKRAEQIALSLRTRGAFRSIGSRRGRRECAEFIELGLLREERGRFVLTAKGKLLADSVAEAFV